MTEGTRAQFRIGQVVRHSLFHYRGVIVDVDAVFSGTEEWYEAMAKSRPPREKPWYHLLVHDGDHMTYVAERNIEADDAPLPINHRMVDEVFSRFENGAYVVRQSLN